jgi:hypothetical protein
MKLLSHTTSRLIPSSIFIFALTLSGCGGGGGDSSTPPDTTPVNTTSSNSGGGGIVNSSSVASESHSSSAITSSSSQRASSSSSTLVNIDGIVSFKQPTVETDETTPTHYQYTVVLDAFDVLTTQPLTISDAPEKSVNLLASDGATVLGTQTQSTKSISCSTPSLLASYDALMLFDRSGSMSDNDPSDDSLAAARKFVTKIGNNDGIKIAQFSGSGNNGVHFLNASFSSDTTYLQALIDAIDSPAGGTPLWDSMNSSLNEFSSATHQKALLTFSDGEDTQSQSNSYDVKALAISTGVKVFSINLRNSNTQPLDDIAFSTGGNVFSTNDAKKLIDYYGVLGNLLSGNTATCTMVIDVNFTPAAGIGEVGYGPASSSIIDTPLNVSLPNNGGRGQISTAIKFPLYPGRKIGQTADGISIFENDIISAGNSNSCLSATTSGVRNNCVESVYASICETDNVNNCSNGLIAPRGQLSLPVNPTKEISISACPWESSRTIQQYVPAASSGNTPNLIFSINNPNSNTYSCTNARRFGR